jgi:hypothetical protein
LDSLLEAHTTTAPGSDPGEHIFWRWLSGQPLKLQENELLERLTTLLGAALQRRVHLTGDAAYQDVGHAFIMQAPVWEGKR